MSGALDQLRYRIRTADTLQRIIGLNVLVFAVLRITNAFTTLLMHPLLDLEFVKNELAVPARLSSLMTRPWTLVTYMFSHWEFMHLLTNMLMLFWFGRILQEYLGSKKMLATYLMGGFSGAVFFMLAFNLLPYFSDAVSYAVAVGASAGAMAVMIASATLLPDYTLSLLLFGPVKLKWIAAVVIFIDLINMGADNAGGHIAHIGGAVYGLIYILMLRKGVDLSGWLQHLIARISQGTAKKTMSRSSKGSDTVFIRTKKEKQEQLDAILDKISKSGYGSLSQQERDFLFKASKEQ